MHMIRVSVKKVFDNQETDYCHTRYMIKIITDIVKHQTFTFLTPEKVKNIQKVNLHFCNPGYYIIGVKLCLHILQM